LNRFTFYRSLTMHSTSGCRPRRRWSAVTKPAGTASGCTGRAQEESVQTQRREQLAARLLELRGIGPESAWTFATELFAWRQFRNRREVGALLGLTPCPYQSGASCTDQGASLCFACRSKQHQVLGHRPRNG
jgi:hypothetical protein